jgi:integration host factor subunit beta
MDKNLTRNEIVRRLAERTVLTVAEARTVVETIIESVTNAIQKGDKVELRGFGTFRTRQRKPRIGRNPKTGSKVDVPLKKVVYFKLGKELKKDLLSSSE